MALNNPWKVSKSIKSLVTNFQRIMFWNTLPNKTFCRCSKWTEKHNFRYQYYNNLFENQPKLRLVNSRRKDEGNGIKLINRFTSFGRENESKFSLVMLASIFSIFQTKDEEEESELIMTIKRAVLMIQHDEFKGAEQMLHVALRLAQQTQNADGITYVHDLLANVAFAQGELDKAEILFKDVMQRVLAQGTPQDDLKIIHMSLKLAKIYEQKKDWVKAEEGFKFCMKHLDKQVKDSDDEDVLMLWGMTLDWYARFLHEQNRLPEALINYKKAYEMCVRLNGEVHEQTVILLNDLGTISFLLGDNDNAIQYMSKAVETGKHLPNMEDFSSVYVNMGNIYMQKEMYTEAQKHCQMGLKNAKRHKNEEGLREATACLEELKHHLRN